MATRHQPVPTSFLDPTVLARIGNLELLARVVVEGFINGLHRSPHLGVSMDFAEHRQYMPGDDIRRIDWRLYARTDRYHMKEYEAETNTNFSVLLDVSRSMRYSSGDDVVSKLDYARYLAACLTYFSHRQRDRVGLVTFAEDLIDYIPCSAKHLQTILHTIEQLGAREPGVGARGAPPETHDRAERGGDRHQSDAGAIAPAANLDKVLTDLSQHFRRRSIVVLVSDLYEEPDVVARAVGRLRGRGNDLIVFHVLDPAEIEFPFDEPANFEELEGSDRMPVIPQYLREQYREQVQAHIAALHKLFGETRVDYALLDTSRPLDFALFEFLSRRERLQRVR